MNTPRTTLYKDKQNAKLMGVCAGLADYTGLDALWWRLGLLENAGYPVEKSQESRFIARHLLPVHRSKQRQAVLRDSLQPIQVEGEQSQSCHRRQVQLTRCRVLERIGVSMQLA